jgi:hypothetical protein
MPDLEGAEARDRLGAHGHGLVARVTPTHDAYRLALTAFQASSPATSPRFMLLITDGQPTLALGCMDGPCDNATDVEVIIGEIAAARAGGIRTFILGSPGSEKTVNNTGDARPWLSRAAEAGGTAPAGCSHAGLNFCHFDMVQQADFAAGLRAALVSIAGQVAACSYNRPPAPTGEKLDPDKVNLVYRTGQGTNLQILRSSSATCTDGWYYGDDDKLNLCSTTCETVLADRMAGLELLFGCAANINPVEQAPSAEARPIRDCRSLRGEHQRRTVIRATGPMGSSTNVCDQPDEARPSLMRLAHRPVVSESPSRHVMQLAEVRYGDIMTALRADAIRVQLAAITGQVAHRR